MASNNRRLELTWTNKDRALLSTGDGQYDYTFVDRTDPRVREVRLLHEAATITAPVPPDRPAHLPAPTYDNLLITGDAMHALDALGRTPEWAAQYLGKIKLVYIDPPFNTKQTFDHYDDNIDHSIWLTMLRDRLRQLRPLLAPDGSVWVHLDDVEVHRCRAIMDETFGEKAFITQVIWQKRTSRENRAAFSESHDTLLVYAPMQKQRWKDVRNRLARNSTATNPDNDPRGPWDSVPFSAQGSRSNQMYQIITPTGVVHDPPKGRCWGAVESEFERLLAEGRIYFPKQGNGIPRVKQYAFEAKGLVPHTIWTAREVGDNDRAKKDMLSLFPDVQAFDTPKPEQLLERIISIATNPGDVVLDCFGGSGTTASAAHKTGRRWVTVELKPSTVETFTRPRLSKVINGTDPTGITTSLTGALAGVTKADAEIFERVLDTLGDEVVGLDEETLGLLRDAATTPSKTVTNWHGGGGFRHLTVGPSMYEVDPDDGDVYLSPAAVNGTWSQSVAAQLRCTLTPDHPVFCGIRGRQRLAVVDGVVDEVVIRTVVEHLAEKERAIVVGKMVLPEAEALLAELSAGSRVKKAPRDLFPQRTVK